MHRAALSFLTTQIESIEKKTERIAMERPRMMEPEPVPWERRRRLRYIATPGIMENAVYLVPGPHVAPTYARFCTSCGALR